MIDIIWTIFSFQKNLNKINYKRQQCEIMINLARDRHHNLFLEAKSWIILVLKRPNSTKCSSFAFQNQPVSHAFINIKKNKFKLLFCGSQWPNCFLIY